MPLVELCVWGKGYQPLPKKSTEPSNYDNGKSFNDDVDDVDSTIAQNADFALKTIVSRRFGDHCDSAVMKLLRDPNEVIVLVFPHKDALDLQDGIRLAEERCGYTHSTIQNNTKDGNGYKPCTAMADGDDDTTTASSTLKKKMTLIFIDATWKYAREMEASTDEAGEWPRNLIRVQMTPSEKNGQQKSNDNSTESKDTEDGTNINQVPTYIERRFHIRTPPSPDHLSTAECISWIASRVESNPDIYQIIMKPLDYMVEIWKGFADDIRRKDGKSSRGGGGGGGRVIGFTDGDGSISGYDSMSQKKRKIKRHK